jgi:peptidyl-prolyl cis-trans isomerase C
MHLHARMVLAVAAATLLAASCSKKKEAAHVFPDSLAADEVIATVNDEPITGRELTVLAFTAGAMMDSTKTASFNLRLLDQMIDRKIFAQEAAAAGVAVEDSVVAKVLDQFSQQFGGDTQVDQMLAPMGIARDDVRAAIQRDLTIRKYVDENIAPAIVVGEGEARAYYDQNPQMFAGQDSVNCQHIILLSHDNETEQQKKDRRNRMELIRQRALDGDNFGALAREFSQDNAAQDGGNLGWFPRGMMVKPFDDAAFALKLNQISEIVETQFGLHIIKCIGKKPARTIPFDEAQASIDTMLKNRSLSTELQNRLQKSRDAAIIVRSYEKGA